MLATRIIPCPVCGGDVDSFCTRCHGARILIEPIIPVDLRCDKVGTCAGCGDDNARLWQRIVDGPRQDLEPRLCWRCANEAKP